MFSSRQNIMGQVWYLIVSIPDLCTITYFYTKLKILKHINKEIDCSLVVVVEEEYIPFLSFFSK